MPTWLLSKWTQYAVVALALWGVWTWHGHERYDEGAKDTRALYEKAALQGAANHAKEIIDGRNAKEAEVRRVRDWADAHRIGPVFLSVHPTVVPVGSPAGAGTCTPGDVASGVHAGDSAVRPRGDTPDIGDLLGAYARVFATKNIDLREQQSVK